MKIAVYCQYVMGVGHLFRMLEICRALKGHDVLLLTGGPPVDASIPDHVRHLPMTGLKMDAAFRHLLPMEEGADVERIKVERQRMLIDTFAAEKPDVALIELYPFGRKAFRFELDPLLEMVHKPGPLRCRTVCSLRDILVEKKDLTGFEKRVIKILGRSFDALLVHGDPRVIRLEATFTRVADISVPLAYTGYVAPPVPPGARERVRSALGVSSQERLVVASAGGGRIGRRLLETVVSAMELIDPDLHCRLHLFTGPFIDEATYEKLNRQTGDKFRMERFTTDFLSFLAAADLSVSMGGYNTCMNILTSRVPALVRPSPRDQEQRLRVERLARLDAMEQLDESDLDPRRLAARMEARLRRSDPPAVSIDMQGAANTARWLENWMAAEKGH
jgi:predicted glycosyltransferase